MEISAILLQEDQVLDVAVDEVLRHLNDLPILIDPKIIGRIVILKRKEQISVEIDDGLFLFFRCLFLFLWFLGRF